MCFKTDKFLEKASYKKVTKVYKILKLVKGRGKKRYVSPIYSRKCSNWKVGRAKFVIRGPFIFEGKAAKGFYVYRRLSDARLLVRNYKPAVIVELKVNPKDLLYAGFGSTYSPVATYRRVAVVRIVCSTGSKR